MIFQATSNSSYLHSLCDKLVLMNCPEIYADLQLANKILQKKYPASSNVRFIEHSYDNLIGLVDELYAIRFPKNSNAWLRSQFEKEILSDLSDGGSIAIPTIIGEQFEPPFLVTNFIQGSHLSPQIIRSFASDEQKVFAEQVAEFAFRMHSRLSVEKAERSRERFGLDQLEEKPWEIHLKEMLIDFTFPTPAKDAIVKRSYEKWKSLHRNETMVVVHDDLHTENMMFIDQTLVGIIDFGDTNTGTPEQELRQLYRINEEVVHFAADKYTQLSGRRVDVETIQAWSVAQELSAHAEHLLRGDLTHPSFLRTTDNLNRWFPEERWGGV